ncbi:MAG: porin [Marinibacterium sp.]|nr:porin [Marinibacterium sp.]
MTCFNGKSIGLGLLSAALATPALAGPVYKNDTGGSFEYYGHLNPAYVNFDDGQESFGEVGDNSRSASRFGFNLRQNYGPNEFRFRFETALGFNGTSSFTQDGRGRAYDWTRSDLRHVDFIYETEGAGTFYAGQGGMFADGLAEYDKSGTGLASELGFTDIAGGYFLRREGDRGQVPTDGVEVSDAFDNFDGSRRGRIRYDSPSFNGFTVGASYGKNILSSSDDDTYYDIGANFERDFGSTEFGAGIAYQWRDRDDDSKDDVETFIASGAVLLQSGLNFALSYGNEKDGGSYVYGKVGFKGDWLTVGSTAIALDYYSGDDLGLGSAVIGGVERSATSSDSSAWGIGVVQKIDDANLEAYAGYYSYAYEDSLTDFDDARSFIIGTRWKF